MKTLLAVVVLVAIVGYMGAGVAAQEARPFIWHRVCDIEPGQGAAAREIAREFMNLNREGSPEGRGRVIAFQSVMLPSNQMHFMQFHPDLGTWQSRTETNFQDPEFLAVFQKTRGVLIGSSCQDFLGRVVP